MSGNKNENSDEGDARSTGKIPPEDAGSEAQGEAKDEQCLPERLKEAEAKTKEHYDRLLRVTAEFENYKKRAEREMNEFRKFANESLLRDLLPVVDNLQRALETDCDEKTGAFLGFRQGVEMTLKGLMDTLERFGVSAIDARGKPFDPNFHQAVSQEVTDQHPDNAVFRELQKGYLLNDRLLRPSMVIVSKNSGQ